MTPRQTFDPKKRITVEEALAHPYLEAYVRAIIRLRDCADPICPFQSRCSFYLVRPAGLHTHSTILMTSPSRRRSTRNFSNLTVSRDRPSLSGLSDVAFSIVHKDDISRDQLKELLYEEIMSFRPVLM